MLNLIPSFCAHDGRHTVVIVNLLLYRRADFDLFAVVKLFHMIITYLETGLLYCLSCSKIFLRVGKVLKYSETMLGTLNVRLLRCYNIVSVTSHCTSRALSENSARYDVILYVLMFGYVLKQLKHRKLCFVQLHSTV